MLNANMTATRRKEFRPDARPPRPNEIRGKLTPLPEGWTLETKMLTEDLAHNLTGHLNRP
jgi:hypothetical protein